MKTNRKVGIIFSTYNNSKQAQKCLKSCLYQLYNEIYIVVADDGSSDTTVNDLNWISASYNCVTILQLDHGERGAARDKAFKELLKHNCSYFLFIDSDMILDQNLVRNAVAYIEKKSVGGLVIPEKPYSLSNNFFTRVKIFERDIINSGTEELGRNSIEAARFWDINEFQKTGGLNPEQISFEEIQPTLRYLDSGGDILRLTNSYLCHDEGEVSLQNILKKKNYYFGQVNKTIESEERGLFKTLKKWYFFRPVLYRRYNIKKYFKHPLLFGGMVYMYILLSAIAIYRIIPKVIQQKLNPEEAFA